MSKAENKIGIISGSSDLPRILAFQLAKFGKEVHVAGIKGFVEKDFLEQYNSGEFKFAQAGKIIDFFHSNQVSKIVFAGKVKRPDFSSIIPDAKGVKLFKRINARRGKGDNDLFEEIVLFLEENGISIVGVDELMPELLVQESNYTKSKPNKSQLNDIEKALNAAKEIGRLDIGQAVAIHDKNIIAVEDIDGTNNLIERSGEILRKRGLSGAILVKAIKPNQDSRIDLPTIGLQTIDLLAQNNFAGIAVEANKTLFLDKDQAIESANKNKLFICGKSVS